MANWGSEDKVYTGFKGSGFGVDQNNYRLEKNLHKVVTTTPDEDAYDAQIEARPSMTIEALQSTMKDPDQQSPAQQRLLQAELDRLTGAQQSKTAWGKNDKVAWGNDDKPAAWGAKDQPAEGYSDKIEAPFLEADKAGQEHFANMRKQYGPVAGTARGLWDVSAGGLKFIVQGVPEMALGIGEGIGKYIGHVLGRDLSDEEARKILQDRPMSEMISRKLNEWTGAAGNKGIEAFEKMAGAPFAAPMTTADELSGPRMALATEVAMGEIARRQMKRGHGGKEIDTSKIEEGPKPPPTQLDLGLDEPTQFSDLGKRPMPQDGLFGRENLERNQRQQDPYQTQMPLDQPDGLSSRVEQPPMGENSLWGAENLAATDRMNQGHQTPDMFDKGDLSGRYRRRATGEIERTEPNPATAPQGLPRALDEQGNFKPTAYDRDNITQGVPKPETEGGVPYYPENPARRMEENNRSQIDKSWEDYQKAKETSQREEFDRLADLNRPGWQPEQQSPSVTKVTRPINNRTPMGRQRGAIDLSAFPDMVKWFTGSRMVDGAGKPKVFYHGTDKDFTRFSATSKRHPVLGGIYFTDNPAYASRYAAHTEKTGGGNVRPVYLDIKNPLVIKEGFDAKALGIPSLESAGTKLSFGLSHAEIAALKAKGYDGIVNTLHKEVVAFEPKQVRSATTPFQTNPHTMPHPHYDGRTPAMKEAASAVANRNPNFGKFKQGGAIDPSTFLDWFPGFKGTKVAHPDGTPKVVYHGTSKDVPFKDIKTTRRGAWFTEDPKEASAYAKDNDSQRMVYNHEKRSYDHVNTASRVYPTYLNLKNPYKLTEADQHALKYAKSYVQSQRNLFERLQREGYDGIDYGHGTWVAFNAESIKSAVSPTGEKSPLGGPGKKQGGAIDLGALFGRGKEPGATKSDGLYSKENIDDVVHAALKSSDNLSEFKKKLELDFSHDEALQKAYVNNAVGIWAERDKLVTNYKGSVYSKLGPASKKVSADLRDWDTFSTEEKIKQIPRSNDIGYTNRITSPSAIMQKVTRGPAGALVKWAISNVTEITNRGTKLYKDMVEHMEDYSKLDRKEQLGLMKTVIDFDGVNNNVLRDAGVQWATADMLREKGLSDRQIAAYQGITKALDKAYKLIQMAAEKFGQEAPERIPGYFPHFWLGSYRVLVHDASGLIKMEAYPTKLQARVAAKMGERQGFKVEIQDPTAEVRDTDIASTMLQALEVFKKKDQLGQAILRRLTAMEEHAQRGIIREALEREGIGGHEADKGIKADLPFWGRAHNDRLVSAYQKHLESVTRFWTNTHIVTEVSSKIHANQHLLKDTPNLNKTLNEFIGRATGNSVDNVKIITELSRNVAIVMGIEPNAARNMVAAAGKFMVTSKLRIPNPKFMGANVLQPFTQLGDLGQVMADRYIQGEKVGNPFKSVAAFLAEEALVREHGVYSADVQAAIKWAKENGKIDTYMADHIDPVKQTDPIFKAEDHLLDKPSKGIEEHGRISTFVMYYTHFKDLMPKREAMEAAANQVDLAMGNYNPMHSASMFTDYGVIGKGARPFALLRNVYLGKAAMAFQTMLDGYKSGKIDKAAVGTLNMANIMTIYMLYAGITGMIGVNEADFFVKMYNSVVNPDTPLPRMNELLRKMNAPDWMIYGLVSTHINAGPVQQPNVGQSLAAPALTEATGIPALDLGQQIATLGMEAYNATTPEGANKNNVRNAVKQMAPPLVNPWVDKMWADKQGGVTPMGKNPDHGYRRDDADFSTYALTGARTLKEENARTVENLMKQDDKQKASWKKEQVSKIVDSLLGIGDDHSSELIKNAFESNRGFDAKTMRESIKAEIQRRLTDAKVERLQEIIRSDNAAEKAYKTQRLQNLMRGDLR